MKKFKKKHIVIFSVVMCLIVIFGVTVWAQDGNEGSEEVVGETLDLDSCYQGNDGSLYGNVTAESLKDDNNWNLVVKNIPANSYLIIQKSDDAGEISKEDIYIKDGGQYEKKMNSGELLIVQVSPKYTYDGSDEKCKNVGTTFFIGSGISASTPNDVTVSGNSSSGTKFEYSETVDSTTQKLACSYDPSSTINTNKFVYNKTIDESNYCKHECQEIVEVKYGPPVLTQAGLGVEYEVTLTSTTVCNSTSEDITVSAKPVCLPYPSCNGKYDNNDIQAGPTDEFDQCVLSCDAGSYSQSCINMCYQKVYSNENLTFSYITPVNDAYGNLTLDYYTQRSNDKRGYYQINSNGKINWISSDKKTCASATSNGKCAGYYYYSSERLQKYTNDRLNMRNQGDKNYFVIDQNGFLRNVRDGNQCSATCEWKMSEKEECKNLRNAQSGVDFFLTEADSKKDQEERIEKEKDKINSCMNSTPTFEKKEVTYKINIDNNGKVTSFSTANEDYKKSMVTNETDNSITYNFPTAYINGKTGEVKYTKLKDSQASGNRFYTSLLSKDINKEWARLKLGDIELKQFSPSGINYNINAEVRNFGNFNWNFDINCFYAINDNINNKDNNNPKYTDFIFRPISLSDVFPASDDASAGRDPRWNWSCSATNTNSSSYPINPTLLTSKIEEKGDSIYEKDNELDYHIVLTKETMSRIRGDNKKHNSYLDYDDMSCNTKNNGMTVCISGFLNNSEIFGDAIKKKGLIGCNNQIGSDCDTSYFSNYTASCSEYLYERSKE